MNTILFLAIFGLLTIFYSILGFISSKRVKNTTDYFLAGRNLGLLPVTFTLVATQIGGGMLLGTSQEAYSQGIFGILYTLGMAIGFIMLGSGIAAKLQSLNIVTTAELFETKYKSPGLKKLASLLSIVTMCGLLTGQIVGSKALLAGLQINSEIIFVLFWLFIIMYTMIGGLYAVVATDTAQVLFIMAVFSGIFIYSLLQEPASFFSLASLTDMQNQFINIKFSSSQLIATLIMPALFSLIEQDLAQRFFASRTRTIATLSTLLSSAILITFALIPIYLGMKAQLLGLYVPTGASPLMPAVSALTNEFVLILAVCGIIAAITSTADSLLCAISSNIAQDFNFSWLGIKNKLKQSQLITLIVGLSALGSSYLVPQNIISILIESYALSVSCLLVPLLFAYYKTNVKKTAAIGAIFCGLVSFIGCIFWQTTLPKELLPLALSSVGFGIGSMFGRH